MTIKENIEIAILNALKDEFNYEISIEEVNNILEVPKEKKNGDFSFPCFNLSKYLKKSPVEIAGKLKEKNKNRKADWKNWCYKWIFEFLYFVKIHL